MPNTWRSATAKYIADYRVYRARPISEAPPSLQLHYHALKRAGLLHRWSVERYGYTIPEQART